MNIARALLGLAYLMLGAALAVAFALLGLGLMSPFLGTQDQQPVGPLVTGMVLLAGLLVAGVGMVPAVRRIEGVAVESMLGVGFAGAPPGPAVRLRDRWRCTAWLWAHLLAGLAFVAAAALLPSLALEVTWWLVAPAFLVALGLGLVLVVALARVAPRLLGPAPHERIARLERQARDLGERNRIARELHDSVGHALSLVTVQAAAARRVQAADPAFVTEALTAIEDAGRRASAELDHALGLLRAEETPRTPAPGLAGLPDLVAAASRAGIGATLEDRLGPEELATLSPVASRELYRVAQEGLANAMRHGVGPCRVLLERTEREVRLEIVNTVATARPLRHDRGRGGSGVAGIVERARALGGSAEVGPVDGGWTVCVNLPWVGIR